MDFCQGVKSVANEWSVCGSEEGSQFPGQHLPACPHPFPNYEELRADGWETYEWSLLWNIYGFKD